MPPRGPGRVGHRWRQASARVYREESDCWLCHCAVDQLLDARHPLSRTVDHLQQLQHGGDPLDRSNLLLAHRRCNSVRSGLLRKLAPEDCACSRGLPCARLTPYVGRGFVSVDPAAI